MSSYRRFWDLSEKERAALTEEELQQFTTVELMERGWVPPIRPVLETIEAVKVPTTPIFVVKHGSYQELDVGFPTAEAALAFLRLGAVLIERDWQTKVSTVKPITDCSVASKEVASEQEAAQHRAALVENAKRKERNEKAERDYQKSLVETAAETADLREEWHRCRGLVEQHRRVLSTWNAYVETAGGDRSIALRFLQKAFAPTQVAEAFAWFDVEPPVEESQEPPVEVVPMECPL